MSLQLEKGKPRTLAYAPELRHDLKLLEVTEDLLEELRISGLSFKGAPNEEAVLCSSSQTFAVKNVETSNLVLLVTPSAFPSALQGTDESSAPTESGNPSEPTQEQQQACNASSIGLATQMRTDATAASRAAITATAIVASHMELIPTAPRFASLDYILAERPLGHPDEEEEKQEGGDTIGRSWDELLAVVQASHEELRVALRSRSAVCINGRWRGVLPSHMTTLLELLLLTCIERGWSLSDIPTRDAARAMQEHGFRPQLTKHCLCQFMSTPRSNDSTAMDTLGYCNGIDGEEDAMPDRVSLSGEAICHHFGTKLLRDRPRWDSLQEFLDAWTAAVPEGYCIPRVEMLTHSGEALLFEPTGGVTSQGIERFSVKELSAVPAERFNQLFSKRPKWEFPELEPYIRGLTGHGDTIETLLLKYARASQQRPTDPVAYSAR